MAEMTVAQLVETTARRTPITDVEFSGDGAVGISGVTLDSRQVGPGDLFVCAVGEQFDGHNFASGAIEGGAAALLVERKLDVSVPQVEVPNTREAVGWIAANLFEFPSRAIKTVGITGTNGKTTTAHILTHVLTTAGLATSVIGTLTGVRTTPESTELQKRFAAERDAGTEAIVMEVSSHALALHRVNGSYFDVAGFTNLTLDHLDFHGTFDAYFEAKASLFTPERCGTAVIDVSSPMGRKLSDLVAVDVNEIDLDMATDVVATPHGSQFTFEGYRYQMPLAGRFNINNALVAIRSAQLLGVETSDIVEAITTVEPVPGRVEAIDHGQPFALFVDYAHTPDGLSKVAAAGRELTDEKLIVLFGCAGDRDTTKRPQMASAAADVADVVVVTSDNPRSEDPNEIIDEVLTGIPAGFETLIVEANRRAAIGAAIEAAGPGDVVVIAGKGHETTQTIGDVKIDFDDRLVAAEMLTEKGWTAT